MNRLIFLYVLLFVFNGTFAQELKTNENQNADPDHKYSVVLNVSPVLGTFLNGGEGYPVVSVIFKRHYNNSNFRIEASFNLSDKNIFLNENSKITEVTDTSILQRNSNFSNYSIQLNTGIEKIKKTKIGTFIMGLDLVAAYFKEENSYNYYLFSFDSAEFSLEPICTPNICYSNIDYFPPNTKQPYYEADKMKVGLSPVIGYEWKLSKRLNVTATINPEMYTTFILKQDYYDEVGYYYKEHNRLEWDYNTGWINVYLSYKLGKIN